MTAPLTAAPRVDSRPRWGVVVVSLLVALASAVGVWALWRLFVTTTDGQIVEQAVMAGSAYGRNRLWQVAEPVLEVISVVALAAVLSVAMIIAVARRRWELAVQVAVVMGGANLTTQVLKHVVLTRPDLGVSGSPHANSLPSGHTTAAMSIAVVLLLVVPARTRPWIALLGAAYTCATGVSTLIGHWHRPSDVVAAVLVVLAWTAATCALTALWPLAYREDRQDGPPPAPATLGMTAATLGVVAFGAGAVAAVALSRAFALVPDLDTRRQVLAAYAGGVAGIVAVTSAAFVVILLLRQAASRRLPDA
ncbi:phosphatase PAP2 family protein [Cellulomonas composti]|uniref:Phosphatidic acid phosphatase type 2/haloperoxidase domain-containing protein n=1 Tax=Cellulomonas composti TaxID=266130 RepID=A0A511JBE8_9CELL|nr:phosphatase PAP2 family protein [Cellulomonas composti]GEL95307.1 hypothetical protein CCO02nite_19650 [Cellulomonas composti]